MIQLIMSQSIAGHDGDALLRQRSSVFTTERYSQTNALTNALGINPDIPKLRPGISTARIVRRRRSPAVMNGENCIRWALREGKSRVLSPGLPSTTGVYLLCQVLS